MFNSTIVTSARQFLVLGALAAVMSLSSAPVHGAPSKQQVAQALAQQTTQARNVAAHSIQVSMAYARTGRGAEAIHHLGVASQALGVAQTTLSRLVNLIGSNNPIVAPWAQLLAQLTNQVVSLQRAYSSRR